MRPEFIAIIATSAFQSVLIGIGIWLVYQQGKMLERIEGVGSATFLDGRKEGAEMRRVIAEVERMIREELLARRREP